MPQLELNPIYNVEDGYFWIFKSIMFGYKRFDAYKTRLQVT